MILFLQDGRLVNSEGVDQFPDANYFSDIEEAARWLEENHITDFILEVSA